MEFLEEDLLRKIKQTRRNPILNNSCVDLALKPDDERDGSKANLACKNTVNTQLYDHQTSAQTNPPPNNNSSLTQIRELDVTTSPETAQSHPQIIIVGGQQLSGLASELIHSRMGSNYGKYKCW
ncbi:hypothetical protein B5X24_HaOG216267 [Helicoverpa armigera]|nr:hypothetical protein B5X24_HaOG216267 [Helicoverpa armigera]